MDPFNKAEAVGVIILAGGKSSRMGTNKALLPIEGKPNIERIRDEMKNVGVESGAAAEAPHFVIVANDPAGYEFLGEPIVSDLYPGLGPLAGIQAGLQASSCKWNVVIACDMPFASSEAATFMLEKAQAQQVDAVVPYIENQLHPLFAVYHKRCADPIEEMLQAERLRMIYLLEKLNVVQVTEQDFPKHMNTERIFYNMNHPAEWQQVVDWLDVNGRGTV